MKDTVLEVLGGLWGKKKIIALYSKALRYTALRSMDLGDTRFLIGSQNT